MLAIADAKTPLQGSAERSRRYRKTHPGIKGGKSSPERRAIRRAVKQSERPFITWDGEGVTNETTGEHFYVLFAGSGPNHAVSVVERKGLSTEQVLEILLDMAERHPDAIHIIYGGSYDTNMWLRDLSRNELERLRKRQYIHWKQYRLAWRPGKTFYVCRLNGADERIGEGVTVYDVVSFFQRPFVGACEAYLGKNFPGRELVVRNKRLRSGFKISDLEEIRRYNEVELSLLEQLANELRVRLKAADLLPTRWDGPGAIAAKLLTREGVKSALSKDIPEPVAKAARHAYAGGRFETIKFGHVQREAYEYDVNSAYPSALRNVPNLSRGTWEFAYGEQDRLEPFALHHVQSHSYKLERLAPLFWRGRNGSIAYPLRVTGWYWTPEVEALKEYCAKGYGEYKILESWSFLEDDKNDRPFNFIEPLYRQRQVLKKAGDGAEVAIKLGLNSMYGKLAQQVGARVDIRGNLRIPPFHQLEYAGYVTSHCRGEVLRAALLNVDAVISFETDALFSSEPLPLPVGKGLGEWDFTQFKDLTYAQSGVYFATKDDGTVVEKCRGVDRGTLTRAMIVEAMGRPVALERKAVASQTRFVGAGIALTQNFKRWRRWETLPRVISVEPMGKRMHVQCDACPPGWGLLGGEWHDTMCPVMNPPHSAEFDVAWINDDPEMAALDMLREEEGDWDE